MQQKRLKQVLTDAKEFAITAELSGGRNFSIKPVEKFMRACSQSTAEMPEGFNFVGVTCTQGPGGTAGLEPATILNYLKEQNLLGDLDFIPHVSCKDHNIDSIRSLLEGAMLDGIESLLVITGDKPITSKGVFDLESVGLLGMIKQINEKHKAMAEDTEKVHQFFAAAAVSPFKYTEPSQMQQYYKMEKKIASGAKFIVTQVGWDWKKSVELMTYIKERNLNTPVIGNVFLLTTKNAAPRLMHENKLPGCFVSDELYAKLNEETYEDHIERAAQQLAMYKGIGAAGADIGFVHDYDVFLEIVNRAAEIGDDWEHYKDNLHWPKKDGFYLYDDYGKRVELSKPKKTLAQRHYEFVHRAILDKGHRGYYVFRRIMKILGAQKGSGFAYRTFNVVERGAKYALFECAACGDCFLPENFGICTMGGCEKGLANVPCGDATVDGMCGNNPDRVCVGELIYKAAAASGKIDKWIETICPPRDISLDKTSSILNYLFEKDHDKNNMK